LTEHDVVDVVQRLRAAGIEFWIEGGWGVDALLGLQTRPHDDLDLGVRMEDAESICATFPEYERDDTEWPSSFVLRAATDRKIDCHPLTFDEHGDGWQPNRAGGPPHRWPREHLEARGEIGGAEVPCISPELQIRWHVFADFDDIDWLDVSSLGERFGLQLPHECRVRPGFVSAKRRAGP
jgi:lincosamide nucleotidyltransferase A/C/D/E